MSVNLNGKSDLLQWNEPRVNEIEMTITLTLSSLTHRAIKSLLQLGNTVVPTATTLDNLTPAQLATSCQRPTTVHSH
jgi:hypothetical protein